MEPRQMIELLAEIFDSVTEVCTGLTEAQWKTATDLPGWSVQDNLAHIVSTERMLQGLPMTEHRATDLSNVRNPIGEFNEHEVDSRRALPGDEVLAEWRELAALRLATLRAADEEALVTPMNTPTGPGTLASFLELRAMDVWSHEQDIRRAVGRPGGLGSPGAAHTVGRMLKTLPIVVGKRAGCPEGETVRVVVTGGVPTDVSITVVGGRAVYTDDHRPARATLTMDTETFLLGALGRRAVPLDQVTIAGDAELARAVLSSLAMMI